MHNVIAPADCTSELSPGKICTTGEGAKVFVSEQAITRYCFDLKELDDSDADSGYLYWRITHKNPAFDILVIPESSLSQRAETIHSTGNVCMIAH